MRIYKTTKKVLSVKNNPKDFLNGLTSNAMDQPRNAFLTIHGRIVATFDQIQIDEDEFLIVSEEFCINKVLEHVNRYAKLAGVKIAVLDDQVYFDLDNNYPIENEGYCIEQKRGKLIITKRDLKSNVTDEEFVLFRVSNGIAQHGVDYTDEMLLNVSMSEFVSFTKGCYLGQEPISKVYNRSKPTWRLEVKLESDCTEEEKKKMTSRVLYPKEEQYFGFVFVSNK